MSKFDEWKQTNGLFVPKQKWVPPENIIIIKTGGLPSLVDWEIGDERHNLYWYCPVDGCTNLRQRISGIQYDAELDEGALYCIEHDRLGNSDKAHAVWQQRKSRWEHAGRPNPPPHPDDHRYCNMPGCNRFRWGNSVFCHDHNDEFMGMQRESYTEWRKFFPEGANPYHGEFKRRTLVHRARVHGTAYDPLDRCCAGTLCWNHRRENALTCQIHKDYDGEPVEEIRKVRVDYYNRRFGGDF